MQRHKSAEKAARKNIKSNSANRQMRSRANTAVRRVLEAKDKKSGSEALVQAYSMLDKSAKSGILHPNNAANKKARLSKFVNRLAV